MNNAIVTGGRIKRKSLKLLEAEGLGVEDIFSATKKSDTPQETLPQVPVKKVKVKASDNQKAEKPEKIVKLKKERNSKPEGVKSSEEKLCSSLRCKAVPVCTVAAVERCSGSGRTSRWYHISGTDHYCNNCFEYYYRSNKAGNDLFLDWTRRWSTVARQDASLRLYIADQALIEWIRCTKCRQWRQLPKTERLTESLIRTFECQQIPQKSGEIKVETACDVSESSLVARTLEDSWLSTYSLPLLLHSSPTAPFVSAYFPDGVGLSPTSNNYKKAFINGDLPEVAGLSQYIQPFHMPSDTKKALTYRPDVMDMEELMEFPEYERHHTIYLGVRNLVLAMWNLNFKEWLSVDGCEPYLICCGAVRIRAYNLLERVIRFLTYRGIINTGILRPPTSWLPEIHSDQPVLIVGAGAAGLGAARHLVNLGAQVVVLEASDTLGGRVKDDHTLGVCVGRGAQINIGCQNNPFSMMSEQMDLPMKNLKESCDLIDECGCVADAELDRRVDFHFNAMLDCVADWRKGKKVVDDINLLDEIRQLHKDFLFESKLNFSKMEERLFQFHISNLEYACGIDLAKVSAINWDQNESYPQFCGEHTLLMNGYSSILNKLSEGIDIRYKAEVASVDYTGENTVTVTTIDGQQFKTNKVLMTVPVSILKKNSINFNPELPEHKVTAIRKIGAGSVEKVALKFKEKFWTEVLNEADFFGRLPLEDGNNRGLFNIFSDVSDETSFVLLTYVCGTAVDLIKDKSDYEVVEMCLTTLRSMFPKQTVNAPLEYFVTRWSSDKPTQMAYSYIPVGETGQLYDDIAEQVQDMIYFAGEATNRQHPQTVTGAYLSGIREAIKIAESLQRLNAG